MDEPGYDQIRRAVNISGYDVFPVLHEGSPPVRYVELTSQDNEQPGRGAGLLNLLESVGLMYREGSQDEATTKPALRPVPGQSGARVFEDMNFRAIRELRFPGNWLIGFEDHS